MVVLGSGLCFGNEVDLGSKLTRDRCRGRWYVCFVRIVLRGRLYSLEMGMVLGSRSVLESGMYFGNVDGSGKCGMCLKVWYVL